jgi:alpha-galactosidase
MGPRITVVGGGSTHWTPRLATDFANTPSLAEAELTLMDLDPGSLPVMEKVVAHIAASRGTAMSATTTTDLDAALDGAEFVIIALSVGGFASMVHDLEIPARYGVRQPVGDSVGPGGISRALRSVPVVLEVARALEQRSPGAVLVNVSNPLSALCRAASSETGITTVGLCNELVGLKFSLSLLFDLAFHEVDPTVGGVNHLPLVTALRLGEEDGFARLRQVLDDPWDRADEPIWMAPPPAMHWHKISEGEDWTKADVVHNCRLKFELFRRFGVLPGSADTHVAEFFAGFCTPESDFGREWGVHHYGLAGHRADKAEDDASVGRLLADPEIPRWPSGELVAELLDGMVGGTERALPVNLPNRGQVASLPEGPVVECMGLSGPDGVRPRDVTAVPGYLGQHLARVVASEETTVAAALQGDRSLVLEAMATDPMAGRLPWAQLVSMTDELLAATAPWLPLFA